MIQCLKVTSHDLIGKMTLKYRRQAGLPIDINGKPIRPYTNSSEAMNHTMSQTKVEYLGAKDRQQNRKFSKPHVIFFKKHIEMSKTGSSWPCAD